MNVRAVGRAEYSCIVLMDDLPLRRAGIKSLLETWAGADGHRLDIVETICGASLAEYAQTARLIIYNIGADSLKAAQLQHSIDDLLHELPNVPLVIIAEHEQASDVIEALRVGARGFISAATPPSIVFQTLSFILQGGMYFPPAALLQANSSSPPLIRRLACDGDTRHSSDLTNRQRAVWQLLQYGHSNKVIARQLVMCESTVKVHMRQIMRKLGDSNRTQAALCGGAASASENVRCVEAGMSAS